MTTDNQRIVFKQGAALTGDSGERGDDTALDGGVESVKPVSDGERAYEGVFGRPTENIRQRTEQLRDAGEQSKYFDDQMRWAFTPGRADGAAVSPLNLMPEITWDVGAGTFTTSIEMVLQPLNTPDVDKQETVDFEFTDTFLNTATVSFNHVTGAAGKRAYNGANLIEIVWLEADTGDLGGALVAGQCDMEISGDPDHILTITIRDDIGTQMSDVQNALISLGAGPLAAMGLQSSITGNLATFLDYSTIATPNFDFSKAFDRELHYLAPAAFSDFFTGPPTKSLQDGDSLMLEWPYYVEDDPGVDGRRQAIPSNANTEVLASQLFISSEYPERMPLAIPLCKRVGADLFWLDGGVSRGNLGATQYPGEHGYTIERILNLDAVGLSKDPYPDPGGATWSQLAVWIPTSETVEYWLDTLLVEVNKCARVYSTDTILGSWFFKGALTYHATVDDSGTPGVPTILDHVAALKPGDFPSGYSAGNPDALISAGLPDQVQQEWGGASRMYTINRPLRGLYAWSGLDYNVSSTPVLNQVYISGGEAIVKGHHIHTDGFMLTDVYNGVSGKGGMTAATVAELPDGGVTWNKRCDPLYVWLRVDGTFWFDIFGVDFAGEYGERNNLYYKPHSDSGLIGGGWEDDDYALVDVCWLVQGTAASGDPPGIRLAGYLPMGGNYRMMEGVSFIDTLVTVQNLYPITYLDTAAGTKAATSVAIPTQNVETGNEHWRNPGVPVVSSMAQCALTVSADTSSCDKGYLYVSVGRTHLTNNHRMLVNTSPFQDVSVEVIANNAGGLHGPMVAIPAGVAGTQKAVAQGPISTMRTTKAAGAVPGTDTYFTIGYETAGSVDAELTVAAYIYGFWWDKFSGPSLAAVTPVP